MSTALITLPERDDMLRRLTAVDNTDHMIAGLYPLILKGAGQPKTALGVILLIQLAIFDYCAGLPPVMGLALGMRLSEYVAALIDDEDVRGDALAEIRNIKAAT